MSDMRANVPVNELHASVPHVAVRPVNQGMNLPAETLARIRAAKLADQQRLELRRQQSMDSYVRRAISGK
jgi:hypothetical protein